MDSELISWFLVVCCGIVMFIHNMWAHVISTYCCVGPLVCFHCTLTRFTLGKATHLLVNLRCCHCLIGGFMPRRSGFHGISFGLFYNCLRISLFRRVNGFNAVQFKWSVPCHHKHKYKTFDYKSPNEWKNECIVFLDCLLVVWWFMGRWARA